MKEGEGMIADTPKTIVLTITLEDSGIRVDGPINNEMLSLYLLTKAVDIVKAHNIMKNAPVIEKPDVMGFARKIFKK